MRPRWLLQLRRTDAERTRRPPPRPVVHRRSGAAGRSDSLGVRLPHHDSTKPYHRGHGDDTRKRSSRLLGKVSPFPPFVSVFSVVEPFLIWTFQFASDRWL